MRGGVAAAAITRERCTLDDAAAGPKKCAVLTKSPPNADKPNADKKRRITTVGES